MLMVGGCLRFAHQKWVGVFASRIPSWCLRFAHPKRAWEFVKQILVEVGQTQMGVMRVEVEQGFYVNSNFGTSCVLSCIATSFRLLGMAAVLPQLVEDPTDAINLIIREFDEGKVGLVQAADKIEAQLRARFLLQDKVQIGPGVVGCDEDNRGSQGCSALDVKILVSDILEVGWSWAETTHATCIEARQGDSTLEEFNMNLVKGTELAPVRPGSLRFGALSCTHNCMGLRAIAAGMPCADPLMSVNGSYCVEALGKRDPDYAEAVRCGLRWRVLSWKVRPMYPRVPGLISLARNVGSTIQRSETEMQVMHRLWSMSRQYGSGGGGGGGGGGAVPWASIKKAILRSRPPCASKLDEMVAFVIAKSGGVEGRWIKYLQSFHRNGVTASSRQGVPASVYEALADFKYTHLAIALLETAWTCPATYLQKKECCFVHAADINAWSKVEPQSKMADVLEAADKLLAKARQLTEAWYTDQDRQEDASGNAAVVLYTKLDVWIGRYVLGKQVGQCSFDSMQDLASAWAAEFASAVLPPGSAALWTAKELMPTDEPASSSADDQKKKKKGQAKGKAKQEVVSLELYEMNTDGEVTSALGRLLNAGFALGSTVSIGGDEVWVVSNVGGENVVLTALCKDAEAGEGASQTVSASSFLKTAKQVQTRDMVVKHPAWPQLRASQLQSTKENIVRGRVWAAMECLMAAVDGEVEEQLQVYCKPKKSVSTRVAIETGKLRLAPEPTSVKIHGASCISSDEDQPPGLVEVTLTKSPLDLSKHRVFLASSGGDVAVAPYWCVEHVAHEDDANMTLIWYQVSSVTGIDLSDYQGREVSRATAAPTHGPAGATPKMAPKPGPRKRLAEVLTAIPGEQSAWAHEVTVPVMVNKMALPVGAALKIAVTSRKAPTKSSKSISVAALAKKQKV